EILVAERIAIFLLQRGGAVHSVANHLEIRSEVFVKADKIDAGPPAFEADELILRAEKDEGPNVLAGEPLCGKRVEVLKLRKVLLGTALVAHHVPIFQIEKCGHEAVPGITDEGEFEVFSKQLRSQNGLETRDRAVCASAGAKEAIANRGAGTLRNVDED